MESMTLWDAPHSDPDVPKLEKKVSFGGGSPRSPVRQTVVGGGHRPSPTARPVAQQGFSDPKRRRNSFLVALRNARSLVRQAGLARSQSERPAVRRKRSSFFFRRAAPSGSDGNVISMCAAGAIDEGDEEAAKHESAAQGRRGAKGGASRRRRGARLGWILACFTCRARSRARSKRIARVAIEETGGDDDSVVPFAVPVGRLAPAAAAAPDQPPDQPPPVVAAW